MANEIIESAGYTRALQLTKTIKINAEIAQQSLYEVCKGLAEMKKDKLFKELGYDKFENYCENEIGITKQQCYKYAAIGENLSGDFVKSTLQIGTEKLYLLAKLDETDRQEIQQNTDLENTSVKELKVKIADLKQANDRLMSKVDEAEQKAEKAKKSETTAWGKVSVLSTDAESYKKKIEELEKKQEKATEENLRSTLILKREKAVLEKKIEELENRPIEIAVAERNESNEVKELKASIKELEEKYCRLCEKKAEDDREHNDAIEIIKAEYEQKLSEIKLDTIVDDKAVFKAYLANAVDASKRMLEFIENHHDEFYKSKAKELFKNLLKELDRV